jgi:acylphosphatase
MKRLHALVSGRVQNVGFRYFVDTEASRMNLVGWVRNLPDRQVEVLAEGDEETLKRFLERLKIGPSGANVQSVFTTWSEAVGEFYTFSIH